MNTPSTNKCCRFCKDPVYNTLTHTVMFYKCKSLSCHCHKPTEPSVVKVMCTRLGCPCSNGGECESAKKVHEKPSVCGKPVVSGVVGEPQWSNPCHWPKPCPLHDKPRCCVPDGCGYHQADCPNRHSPKPQQEEASSSVPMGRCHRCDKMFPAEDLWGNISTKEVTCNECHSKPQEK